MWTLEIHAAAPPRIAVLTADSRSFSRDEALAISTIATAQHCDQNSIAAILSTLLGEVACERVVDATVLFADALRHARLCLSIRNVCLEPESQHAMAPSKASFCSNSDPANIP